MTADFIPLVPLASSGGRGRLTHTSQPGTRRGADGQVVVVEIGDAAADLRDALGGEQRLQAALAVVVAGVRLAGEQDLDRALAREQVDDPLGALQQQVQALVGGQAPGEADREHVGVEVRGLDVVARLVAARRSTMLRSRAQATSAARCSRRTAHSSASWIVVEPVPRGGIGGAVHPALAEVAVEQRAHRVAQPGREVHAVGDVADRHVVHRRGRATARPTSRARPRRGGGSRRWPSGSCAGRTA